jgi:competence protein ComEC
MPLLILCIAWIAGIFLGSIFYIPVWTLVLSLCPLVLLLFYRRHLKNLLLAIPVILLFLGGGMFYQYSQPVIDESSLRYYNDKDIITVEGMVSSDPAIRDRTISFHFDADTVYTDFGEQQIKGTAMVKTLAYNNYSYGDVLIITGVLETPENSTGFDYKTYLTARNIYTQINYPRIEIIDTGNGLKPLQWIYNLRSALAESINRALPMPQSSLAQAMFLGITTNIPQELRDSFSQTGTNHILAISGMNLTIIMGMLLSLGIWIFGRRYSIYVWLALAVIWFYTILTGIQPPIVRSAIMGSIFLLAELLGRQKNSITGIAFAAAVMIGLNPPLLKDVSFQLSFLSMCGLIFVYPPLQRFFIKDKSWQQEQNFIKKTTYSIFDGFIVIISVILLTWPMIAYHFGIFALSALPATLFILPVFPAIILVTFLVATTGLFLLPLAQVLGWIDWLLLSYFILIVNIFKALPFASLTIMEWQLWQTAIYYAVFILVFICVKNYTDFADMLKKFIPPMRQLTKSTVNRLLKFPLKWIFTALAITNILVWIILVTMPDDRLHVSVLDVGQGDSILIQTPDRQTILIDGGPGPSALETALGSSLPFWDRKIDLVVITQPHTDHISGLSRIINNYDVGMVIYNTSEYDSVTFRQLMDTIENKGIPHSQVHSCQTIDTGSDVSIKILHPAANEETNKNNDPDYNNLVMKLAWNEISFIFMADTTAETELELISGRADICCSVIKIGHHGSNTSTCHEFLSVAKPCAAVISAGKDNPYGHPDKEVVLRILEFTGEDNLFITSEHGTVEFITDGNKLWVHAEKQ